MLGRITYTGKKQIRKSSGELTVSSKRSNAIHLKGLENLSRSSTLYQDTGRDESMKSTESYIKLLQIPFI